MIRRTAGKPAPEPRVTNVLERRREARQLKHATDYESVRTPTGEPGAIVAIHANETPFTDILDKARYEQRPARVGPYIHVSNLIQDCVRQRALMGAFELPIKSQQLSLTDSLTFKQGDAIHDVLKARGSRGGPRLMWGNWRCHCEQTHTTEPCLRSEVGNITCTICKTELDEYVEVPMVDDEYMVVGTPDVIMYLPNHSAFHVTEIKSIAHDKWKDLVRPVPDHVIQSLFYWFLMHRKGYTLTNRVSVIYATKGWMFSGAPTKEFTYDAAESVKRLEPYLDDALALKAANEGGALPPRIKCATPESPDAKKCVACRVCFKDSDDERPTAVNLEAILSPRRASRTRR